MSSALYRRYRPETFAEVIGQSHVTDPLQQALRSERTNHAYLFSGPRGCGKTTSARILARCLNCHEGPTDTPCGVCPSCVELARDGGGSLDVVEIDAASHNGVDDARELRERAVFAPARDRFKIFILDEAHMVTQQGFNALLKIVEEPPEHVKFIFATTEPDKVLTTIRSRTHHYPFRLVPPAELVSYLEGMCESEGVEVEPGVLALVVRSGGGSVRDSLSLLDQLMAGSPERRLTLEHAQALLGYTPQAILDDVMQSLSAGDQPAVFRHIDRVLHTGVDPRRFTEDILTHLRDVLVIQAAGAQARDLFPGVSPGDLDRWSEHAQWFSQRELTEMADVVSHTLAEMGGVTSPRLHLEVMMAKILVQKGAAGAPSAPRVEAAASSATSPVSSGTPRQTSEPQEAPKSPSPAPSVSAEAPVAPVAAEVSVALLEPWTLESVEKVWPAIIESLAATKRSLWLALSDTRPVALDGDVLTMGFVRRSDAEILKKPQGPGSPLPNADVLRDAIYQHTGHRVRFTVTELSPDQVNTVAPSTAASPTAASVIAEPPGWPVVARPGSDVVEEDSSGSSGGVDDPSSEETESTATAGLDTSAAPAPTNPGPTTPVLGQRGEPAIRSILGGELIAEEVWEKPAGDTDV